MQNYSPKKGFEVLLINPSSSKGDFGRGDFFTPPMGLAYLASYLQCSGISVDIIDCNPEEIFIDYFSPSKFQKQRLSNVLDLYETPIVVGIGPLTTPFLKNGLAIANFVKEYFKHSYVVVGGPHPSIDPPTMAERMLDRFQYIDAVCINEGEKPLLELMKSLRTGGLIKEVEGLVFRSENGHSYKARNFMGSQELNSLPFPNRDLLEKYSYRYKLAVRRNFSKILSDRKLAKKYGKNPKFTVLFSSRGCPYKCTFCCSHSYRSLRSAENVVNEIELCIDKYDIHCFVFYDDLLTTSSPKEIDRVKTICNLIKEKKLEIFWGVELRADVICNLGQEVLGLMFEGGCQTVNIGIEKATDKALKWLKKGVRVSQIKKAINILRKSGDFIVNGTFILGGNFETENDIVDVIAFSKELGLDYAAYYPLEIHPGTIVFDRAKDSGIVDDILDTYISDSKEYPIFTNPNLDVEKLMVLQCKAYREFYFDPNYIESLINKLSSVSIVYEQYEHIFEHAFLKGVR